MSFPIYFYHGILTYIVLIINGDGTIEKRQLVTTLIVRY